ncbi:endonuclease III [Patescibacteria group bacterium]|nr:endonuclease III [Patescibacteria group bacterium]
MKKQIKQLHKLRKFSEKESPMRLAAESWDSDFKTLIAIILSARTRDETTIKTAEKLFIKYPDPFRLAKGRIRDIERLVFSVNFYKNKAKNIRDCSKKIVLKHKGKVPYEFEDLITLPGVGRKTANVFLSEVGFDTIGVDTHLSYISNYLGWTSHKKQKKIEEDLKKIFPKIYWKEINPTLVKFGKTYTSKKQKDVLLEKIKKIK